MAYYYSASERAFFSSEFMTVGEMPSDKVAVADDAWKRLIADQSSGRIIRSASNRSPESAAQTLPALTGYLLPDDVSISGSFEVSSGTTLKGALTVSGKTNAKSVSATDITTTGNATVGGALTATGTTSLKTVTATNVNVLTLDTTGNATVGGALNVNGETKLKGATEVSGTSSFTGAATFYNRIDTSGTIYADNNAAVRRKGSDGFLQLGMETVKNGGRLNLYGKDYTSEYKGGFELGTGNGTNVICLVGLPNGALSWNGRSIARSVDGVLAGLDGDVALNAMPYKKLTSINSVKGCFWFDSNSGIEQTELPEGVASADWVGCQMAMLNGGDKTQFIYSNKEWYTRNADQNHGNEKWSAWERFDPSSVLKTDGSSTMSGSIKSSVGNNSWVNAANGTTIITNSVLKGEFAPLWNYESSNGGSYVFAGYKDVVSIRFISADNKASNTNRADWAIDITENGNLTLPRDLSVGGALRFTGSANRLAAYVEQSSAEGHYNFVLAGANEATFICSGERGYDDPEIKAFRESLPKAGEDIVLASDNNIVLAANCNSNTAQNVRKVEIDSVGNIRFPARMYPSLENGVWSDSPYVIRHGRIDRTSLPEKDEALYIPFYGAGGISNATHRLARITYIKRTNGNAEFSLGVNNPNNATAEEFCGLTARWRRDSASGEVYLSQHPGVNSDDYTVATTGWVNKTVNAKTGTMTKKGSRSSAGTLTVSGLKVDQLLVITCDMRNDTYDGGDYALVEADNVVNGWFKTGARTGFYTTFMIATASTVNFKLTHQGISSNTMTVYAMG